MYISPHNLVTTNRDRGYHFGHRWQACKIPRDILTLNATHSLERKEFKGNILEQVILETIGNPAT